MYVPVSFFVNIFFDVPSCARSGSHAFFTIEVEQPHKWDIDGDNPLLKTAYEDCLCANLNLVDLAGSELSKRTGSEGCRFHEGD
jgi:hypothetical protein